MQEVREGGSETRGGGFPKQELDLDLRRWVSLEKRRVPPSLCMVVHCRCDRCSLATT